MKAKFSKTTEFKNLQQREPKLLIPYYVCLRDSKLDLFLPTGLYFFTVDARRTSSTHLVMSLKQQKVFCRASKKPNGFEMCFLGCLCF